MDPLPDERGLLAGRYRLRGVLGRGGMAEVYDGFDQRLDRPVAVKILRPTAADDAGMRERFEREARSVARLSHPAVVAVYDSGEDRGRAFLVMERLPGETLADRIRLGPVEEAWLVPIAADVLGALGAAHTLGLVHRDIKPANILLTADGRAKVADFGIAKTYRADGDPGDPSGEDLTATGLILGTVAYLSPEQIHGASASPQADIYAVGVVLYEALAGRKPFVGESAIVQAHAVSEGTVVDLATLRPDIDSHLVTVVRRAMARRVEDRYQTAAAMLGDLIATGLVARGDVAPPVPIGGPDATVAMAPPTARPDPAATAVLPVIDATQVLAPGPSGAGPSGSGPPAPGPPGTGARPPAQGPGAGGRPGRRRRAWFVTALIVLTAAVAVAAVIAVAVNRNSTPRTIPPASTTTAPTTAPTNSLPAVIAPTSTSTTTTPPTTIPPTTIPPTTTTSTAPPTTTTSTVPPATAPPTTAPPTTVPVTTPATVPVVTPTTFVVSTPTSLSPTSFSPTRPSRHASDG